MRKPITELDALRMLERRVKAVLAYSWEDNDSDAAKTIEALRTAYERVMAVRSILKEQPPICKHGIPREYHCTDCYRASVLK